MASLPATLEGNARSRLETCLFLHRACNPSIWRQPDQRDPRNSRFGLGGRCHLLKGRRCFRSSVGLGSVPRRGARLGDRAFSRGNYGVSDQSCARFWAAPCPRGTTYCRQGRLRLGLRHRPHSRATHRRWPGRPASKSYREVAQT